ncbi:hypothetical protein AC578_2431 [Pseudocercospora eumusae]|uniref:Osmotin, thaumatin-like protein n=1 Tax=Pseudocercospora eumusae TaxID=321146 RepID=A0A139HXV3_9PEZI|nr:hypothetical protein AC578_2431 [Pseudocercospora eumusae]
MSRTLSLLVPAILSCSILIQSTTGLESPSTEVERRQGNSSTQLQIVITNSCSDRVWPGITTQNGDAASDGFALDAGTKRTINVPLDWEGRIWGRTNCTFPDGDNANGKCLTGECGALKCNQAGNPPATLAEFTMDGSADQTFYDLSLVDGYNLPMAIVLMPNGVRELANVTGGETNPSCVGSVNDLAPPDFNPYANNQQFLGTTSGDKLPFDTKNTAETVTSWCPWDLQLNAPAAPGNGVYPYPDGNVKRPAFNPCNSACAKYNKDKYCCKGQYEVHPNCPPNYYSKAAKSICPDAYSYAQDDPKSTFTQPKGGSFEVIFCPGGRSTNILATKGGSASGASSSRRLVKRRLEDGISASTWAWLALWSSILFAPMVMV